MGNTSLINILRHLAYEGIFRSSGLTQHVDQEYDFGLLGYVPKPPSNRPEIPSSLNHLFRLGLSAVRDHISPTARVDGTAIVPKSARVWDYSQIRENVIIGENCIIGRNVYVGPGVKIGNNCKIQNNALIYEPAIIEDGVFVGPAVVLTNDKNPRATNADGSLKQGDDWEMVGVTLKSGSSVGANSVCIAPVVVGEWALVGAGSVVTKDVPSRTTVAGNPAVPMVSR